jgi:hypothetical protein
MFYYLLIDLFWLSYPDDPVLGCPVLTSLSWFPHPGCLVPHGEDNTNQYMYIYIRMYCFVLAILS